MQQLDGSYNDQLLLHVRERKGLFLESKIDGKSKEFLSRYKIIKCDKQDKWGDMLNHWWKEIF